MKKQLLVIIVTLVAYILWAATAALAVDYKMGVHFAIDHLKQGEIDEDYVNTALDGITEIASGQVSRCKDGDTLHLVIQAEIIPKYAYKDGIYNLAGDPYNIEWFAKELQKRKIKWTPLINVIAMPYEIEEKYSSDQNSNGHDMPFKPDSLVWDTEVKIWIEKAIEELSPYMVGEDKVIEEILVTNEMMYGINSQPSNVEQQAEDLALLLYKLRDFAQKKLKALGVVDIPVSWKIAAYPLDARKIQISIL